MCDDPKVLTRIKADDIMMDAEDGKRIFVRWVLLLSRVLSFTRAQTLIHTDHRHRYRQTQTQRTTHRNTLSKCRFRERRGCRVVGVIPVQVAVKFETAYGEMVKQCYPMPTNSTDTYADSG